MGFETNVFINCPFDNEFRPILRGVVFTCLHLWLEPLNISNHVISQYSRYVKLSNIYAIPDSSIHDLSRIRSKKAKNYQD